MAMCRRNPRILRTRPKIARALHDLQQPVDFLRQHLNAVGQPVHHLAGRNAEVIQRLHHAQLVRDRSRRKREGFGTRLEQAFALFGG